HASGPVGPLAHTVVKAFETQPRFELESHRALDPPRRQLQLAGGERLVALPRECRLRVHAPRQRHVEGTPKRLLLLCAAQAICGDICAVVRSLDASGSELAREARAPGGPGARRTKAAEAKPRDPELAVDRRHVSQLVLDATLDVLHVERVARSDDRMLQVV